MTNTSMSLKLQAAAAVAAVILVSALVLRVSSAVFSGTTTNGSDTWAAGTVTLTDNDGGTALFTETARKPGDSGTNCITVTYGGSITPSDVRLYASTLTDTPSGGGSPSTNADRLSDDLDIKVEILDPVTYGTLGCALATGTSTIYSTAPIASFPTTYAGGASTTPAWTPVSGNTRIYRFTWTLGSDTANDAQGDAVAATFTWEAQAGS